MTDKEFRKLRRSDLIEIIYEYQKREEALRAEIASLKEQLSDRAMKLKDAGSIAEAVIRLNALFETAQKTADDYVEQVRLQCEAAKQAPEHTGTESAETDSGEAKPEEAAAPEPETDAEST